jgi:hypothetical protein
MAFFCLVGRCQRQGLARPTASRPATPRRMAIRHPWPFPRGRRQKTPRVGTTDGVASGDASSNGRKPFLPLYHQRLLRGVGRTTGDGLAGKRSPEGESAGGAERAEAMDGRRERPATWCGQSRARQRAGTPRNRTQSQPRSGDVARSLPSLASPRPRSMPPAYAATDRAAARVTDTTAAASYSPSPDRGDRTETSFHNVTPSTSLPRPHRLHSRVARRSDSKTLIATVHFSEAATVASARPAACFLTSAA